MKKKFQLKTMCVQEKDDQRKFGVMSARISLLLTLQACVMFVLISFASCEQREFDVTPLPKQFEYIPPSDVGLLKAASSDGTIIMSWSAPPEDNITKIHIQNLNNGSEIVLDGTMTSAELTGLTNLVSYDFVVKVENSKSLLSHGATISAVPFKKDAVKPGTVLNLIGFKLSDGAALATWDNPQDPDLSEIVVHLGKDSVVVARPLNYTIIKGDVTQNLSVQSVDLSRNYSENISASVSGSMISISGEDDGEYETVKVNLHPAVVIVDSYKIKWGVDKEVLIPSSTPTYKILLSEMGWLDKISVTPMSNGSEITEYKYDHHNGLPGTIRAAYFDSYVGTINIEGDMRNIGSIDDNESCVYDIVINEDGLYDMTAFCARPDGTAKYEIYLDGALAGTGEVGGTGGWGNFAPFQGPTLDLLKGKYSMTIKFLNGGANYQKFYFEKL